MKADTVVYSGPTLLPAEIQEILPQAVCLEPVSCGDIFQILRLRPKNIIIIDGYFERTASVWHKEILLAMEQGVVVYGASSMGALRAAELDSYGMIGFGEIYQKYKSGEIIDDDEVAITHGTDALYSKTGTALINDRFTLAAAVATGIIDNNTAAELIRRLKNQPYYLRSIFIECRKMELDKLLIWLQSSYIDQKKNDALGLLKNFKHGNIKVFDSVKELTKINKTIFAKKIYREVSSLPFQKNYIYFHETEKISNKLFSLDQQKNLTNLAKLLHIMSDIQGGNDKNFFHNIDFENLKTLRMLKNYLVYTGKYKNYNLQCIKFIREGVDRDIDLKISLFIASLLKALLQFIDEKELTVSPVYQQQFFDGFRKKYALFSLPILNNWLGENDLQQKNQLHSFVFTMSVFQCFVENNNVDYLGIKTCMNYTNWLEKAKKLVMTVPQFANL